MTLSGLSPVADARHACYPGRCRQGDARLGSIGVERPMYQGRTSFVSVNGRNIGAPSDVVGSLRSKNAHIEPFMSRRVFVGADQPVTIYFQATPRRAERTRFKGCLRAEPEDFDNSNNCGSVRVKVHRAPS